MTGTLAAERRQVTVMFCDLVGSTALSEHLDPEDLREVLHAYHTACEEVVRRFDGHIAQYLGDGLLVYFGYPLAHEDDPRRAVHVGLGIVDAAAQLQARLPHQDSYLAVRLGIHTGLVVAGEVGAGDQREMLAVGSTPNVAARLQGEAEPNTVVISAATERLVQGFFTCRALGSRTLKGVAQPMDIYQVLQATGARGRIELAPTAGLTPLLGRDDEFARLLTCWERAARGSAQTVLLDGEAGIGKSRLVRALTDRLASQPHQRLEGQGSPYYEHSALYPLIEMLNRNLNLGRDETVSAKLARLERFLTQYGVPLPEVVPLLAGLLALPLDERYPPLALSPAQHRQRTMDAVVRLLLAMAAQQSLLLVLEDLHWVDPSTLELLGRLMERQVGARILILLTARLTPDFESPWPVSASFTRISLARLPSSEIEAVVAHVAGGKALPREVLRQIVTKTDGVPLFVEELTKMVLESGYLQERDNQYLLSGPLPPLAIPTTLHDSLMARLDRLGTIREVAQLGATIGRAFSYELLRVLASHPDPALQQDLARLVDAELLYQQGTPPQATYTFKHALIQETAYESVLRGTRQRYHQQIAQVLEDRFPGTVATQPELLAHHYTAAGQRAQAVPYWQRAGQRAVERSANAEAIAHLTRGLELVRTLPETPERAAQELALHATLGTPLIATKGYASPEVGAAYSRARELCRQVGDTPQLFPAMWGLWVFYTVQVDLQTAHELGAHCLSLAQAAHDPGFLLEAHAALAVTEFYRGQFRAAEHHVEQSCGLYDPQQHRAHAFAYGQDPGVVALGYAARTLPLLGYPGRAAQRAEQLLSLAAELSHQHSVGAALMHVTVSELLRREGAQARERADTLIRLCTEQELLFWMVMAQMLRGAALIEEALAAGDLGRVEEAMTQTREDVAGYRALGAGLDVPACLLALAKGHLALGQVDAGLTVVADAITDAHRTGQWYYEAELYRLRGELQLARGADGQPEAEDALRQAVAVARRQDARLLELRAAISLCRLWQQQRKRDEARQTLATVFGWFTEGFETRDLREAKAVLAELA